MPTCSYHLSIILLVFYFKNPINLFTRLAHKFDEVLNEFPRRWHFAKEAPHNSHLECNSFSLCVSSVCILMCIESERVDNNLVAT